MATTKAALARGTRDFGPEQMRKRQFIIGKLRSLYEKFGFEPLETPAIERLDVLTGKYGEEGDRLIFKILNSGDFLAKTSVEDYQQGAAHLLPKISEKALRYDLTVPFARYVVQNRGSLSLPFRRYQIQPVWRADRPQKGRFREFYQCDADVIGTDSLLCEAEILAMLTEGFDALGLSDCTIHLNNRKVLQGFLEKVGAEDRENQFLVSLDKLDKIGAQAVMQEWEQAGIDPTKAAELESLLVEKHFGLEDLKPLLAGTTGQTGLEELEEVFRLNEALSGQALDSRIRFSPHLARGLSYYTGCIFEVSLDNIQMGSVCGGGRYDNLTGVFGWEGVSGVGISFGIDRLYEALNELEAYPPTAEQGTQVLFTHFNEDCFRYALGVLGKVRQAGIAAEVFPQAGAKFKKQFQYAHQKGIPYVATIGPEEKAQNVLQLKNMQSGAQALFSVTDFVANSPKTLLP